MFHISRGYVQLNKKSPLVCIMRPRKGKKKVVNDDDVSRADVGMQYELTPVCERLVNIPKVKEAHINLKQQINSTSAVKNI